MTKDEIDEEAQRIAIYVRKCHSDEELVELLAASLALVHKAGEIVGGESLAAKIGLSSIPR